MQHLARIGSIYSEIDAGLERQRTDAQARGDANMVQRIESKQAINDQAYFVLCWGQLETEIDKKCRNAIRNRLKNGNWANRRAWDLFNPDDKRLSGLSFEDRTALVLDKSRGSGSPWALVMSYYALRNQLAHGNLTGQRIEVPAVIQQFYVIQGNLQP
jgi:hypothetical protein